MSMYGKNHYNIVINLQLIKVNEKEKKKKEDHGILSHHCMTNRLEKNGNSDRLNFLGLQDHCGW